MKMELKNMYLLMEENKDLKEDLERLKSLTYEDRMKQILEENQQIRRRNGELLIKCTELEQQMQNMVQEQEKSAHFDRILGPVPASRPQTSQGAFMRKKEDIMMMSDNAYLLSDIAQDDFDKELEELVQKT